MRAKGSGLEFRMVQSLEFRSLGFAMHAVRFPGFGHVWTCGHEGFLSQGGIFIFISGQH